MILVEIIFVPLIFFFLINVIMKTTEENIFGIKHNKFIGNFVFLKKMKFLFWGPLFYHKKILHEKDKITFNIFMLGLITYIICLLFMLIDLVYFAFNKIGLIEQVPEIIIPILVAILFVVMIFSFVLSKIKVEKIRK